LDLYSFGARMGRDSVHDWGFRVSWVPGLGERLSLALLSISHGILKKKFHGRLGVVSSRDFNSVPNSRGTVSISASFPNFARSGKGDSSIKAIPGQALGKSSCDLFSWHIFEIHQPYSTSQYFSLGDRFLLHTCVSSAVWVRLLFHSRIAGTWLATPFCVTWNY